MNDSKFAKAHIKKLKNNFDNDVKSYFDHLSSQKIEDFHKPSMLLKLSTNSVFNEYLYFHCFNKKFFDLLDLYNEYYCAFAVPKENDNLFKYELSENFNNDVDAFLAKLDDNYYTEFAGTSFDFNAYVLDNELLTFSELLEVYDRHGSLWHIFSNLEIFKKAYNEHMIDLTLMKKYYERLDSLTENESDEFLGNPYILKVLLENSSLTQVTFDSLIRLCHKFNERGIERLFSMKEFINECIAEKYLTAKHISHAVSYIENVFEIDELFRNEQVSQLFLTVADHVHLYALNTILSNIDVEHQILDLKKLKKDIFEDASNMSEYLASTQKSERNVLDFIAIYHKSNKKLSKLAKRKKISIYFEFTDDECDEILKLEQTNDSAKNKLKYIVETQLEKTFTSFEELYAHLKKAERRTSLGI